MAAQIRQEINIIDTPYTCTTSNVTANEIISIDTTKYNGTVNYYLEVEATNSAASDRTCTLFIGITSQVVITVTASTASMTLFRSASFTPSNANDMTLRLNGAVSGTLTVKSARIIVIQNDTSITTTETQIEIGNAATTTSTTPVAITNPKYWKYTAANWDGTITAKWSTTVKAGNTKSGATVTLETSSSITAPSWSFVDDEVSASLTPELLKSTTNVTLVDGNWYRITLSTGTSKSAATLYNAKIIIDQTDGVSISGSYVKTGIQGGTGADASQAIAQSFKIRATSTITGVKLLLSKVGSPTDTLNIDIVSSLGGVSLANATQACSSLTTTLTEYTYNFGSPVSLTGGNTYYIQLSRSPDTFDGTNQPQWGITNGVDVYSGGGAFFRTANVWGTETTSDAYFSLIGQAGLTKTEPQYLLANTLFAAGTGLQTFLTKWDSTEWDAGAGSISYYSQAEAANDSTSDVTIEEADGGGTLTNSTLTNIDNAQISGSAITMPTSQNLDTKATTNAGDVAAARILVLYTFSASAPIVNTPYNGNQMFMLTGVGI